MPPELPDVVVGETIAAEWGNDVRDRTVQRYADTTERGSEHPSPTGGDLSYLADSNTVWVYDGASWVSVYPADPSLFEVDGSTEENSPGGLSGTMATKATVSLIIPSDWGSWKCMAYATYQTSLSSEAAYESQIRIDGTDQQLQQLVVGELSFTWLIPGTVAGRRTGMTTTGSRNIELRQRSTAGSVNTRDIFLYARAVRTS